MPEDQPSQMLDDHIDVLHHFSQAKTLTSLFHCCCVQGWVAVRHVVELNITNWQQHRALANRWKQPNKPPTWEDVILMVCADDTCLAKFEQPYMLPILQQKLFHQRAVMAQCLQHD